MNIRDALAILGLSKTANQEQITLAYRKASSKYHPDRNPGGLEMMKSINIAYALLVDQKYDGSTNPMEGEESRAFGDELMTAINAVIDLEGLIIEVCGSWVWVSGDTRTHKDAIKAAGYFWASKKSMWYWKPSDYKAGKHSAWDIDKIRDSYGSETVKRSFKKAIAA